MKEQAKSAEQIPDCNCSVHELTLVKVNVVHIASDHDWGVFIYCQQAIKDDRDDGFLVINLQR